MIVMDNFNRVIRTANWGKNERIDVVHGYVKMQEVYAPTNLSRTQPAIPLSDLSGKMFYMIMICAPPVPGNAARSILVQSIKYQI